MNKKYIVQLTPDQRTTLEHRTRTGTTTAAVQRHARILLKADTAAGGPGWDDAAIAAAVEVSVPTVERVRRQFVLDWPGRRAPPQADQPRLATQTRWRPGSPARRHRL